MVIVSVIVSVIVLVLVGYSYSEISKIVSKIKMSSGKMNTEYVIRPLKHIVHTQGSITSQLPSQR